MQIVPTKYTHSIIKVLQFHMENKIIKITQYKLAIANFEYSPKDLDNSGWSSAHDEKRKWKNLQQLYQQQNKSRQLQPQCTKCTQNIGLLFAYLLLNALSGTHHRPPRSYDPHRVYCFTTAVYASGQTVPHYPLLLSNLLTNIDRLLVMHQMGLMIIR